MVLNFFKDCYDLIKHKVQELKKAYAFKNMEYTSELKKINKRELEFLMIRQNADINLSLEAEHSRRLNKSVNRRYLDNILRVLGGYSLVQEEESALGVGYTFNGYRDKFFVTDEVKYNKACEFFWLEGLESNKLNSKNTQKTRDVASVNGDVGFNKKSNKECFKCNKGVNNKKARVNDTESVSDVKSISKYSNNSNNSSLESKISTSLDVTSSKSLSHNSDLNLGFANYNSPKVLGDAYVAMYVKDFRSDCFTNTLAKISSEYSGSIKKIADSLSGYVYNKDSIISPHKRSWSSRVDVLEDLLFENNFTRRNVEKLIEIKDVLSKNKYLTSKKKEEYQRAVSLIDKVVKRYKNVAA